MFCCSTSINDKMIPENNAQKKNLYGRVVLTNAVIFNQTKIQKRHEVQ